MLSVAFRYRDKLARNEDTQKTEENLRHWLWSAKVWPSRSLSNLPSEPLPVRTKDEVQGGIDDIIEAELGRDAGPRRHTGRGHVAEELCRE